jgi:hypothetical protein
MLNSCINHLKMIAATRPDMHERMGQAFMLLSTGEGALPSKLTGADEQVYWFRSAGLCRCATHTKRLLELHMPAWLAVEQLLYPARSALGHNLGSDAPDTLVGTVHVIAMLN